MVTRESSEDRYDAYLDALLRGEEVAPEAFLEAHAPGSTGSVGSTAAPGGLPAWLHDVWRLVQGERATQAGDDDAPASDLPCERVGPFRLLRLLGEGGMGRVFLARQEALGRLCAVKLLRSEHAASPTAIARLVREGRLLASLRHDALLRVLDAGDDDGTPWVALELVPGQNLDERIAAGRPPVNDVVRWGAELADGLAHAHAAGVVHRDVKPSNVRVTPDGRALLLDFGLARDVTRDTLRLTHAFTGTPMYVAPEQVRGGEVDGRCDVYGLGATLYEALTGAPPFEGEALERVLHAVVHDAPPSFKARGVRVPLDVETVVMKCLEKAPARRYQGAAALRDDLRAVLALRPIQARRSGLAGRLARWSRRNPVPLAALLTALVAASGFFVRDALRAREARRERQREANALVEAATTLVARYDDGRAIYERANFDLRDIAALSQVQHVKDVEVARLGPARAIVADYEALRVSLEDVPVMLGRAERLDPTAAGLGAAWAAYWFQLWMDVRDDEERAPAAHYRARILEVDPDGTWTQRVSGHVALAIRSDPPGASVHLFRVETLREPAGERYVPRPLEQPLPGLALGAWALEVLDDCGELRAGDCIVESGGLAVRDALQRATASAREDPLPVRVLRGGALLDLALPDRAPLRTTGAPLPATPESFVGTTPLEFPASEPGFYVALLTSPGREPRRLSFHLDHACEHYARGLELTARLFPRGTTPPGFAYVDVAAFGDGERSFWVQRYEVTAGDYAAFLRSDTGRGALAGGALERPRLILGDRAGDAWPVDEDGRVALPPEVDPAWPMLGVSVAGARAYAAWFERRAGLEARGLLADLPTLGEWRWAAYGGDGRAYVYGRTFAPAWVKSRYSREAATPEPVGAFPLDESPWGIHDLAGSAAEWVHEVDPWRGVDAWALAGGAWDLAAPQDFAIGRTRYLAPDEFDAGAGFRLVLREVLR